MNSFLCKATGPISGLLYHFSPLSTQFKEGDRKFAGSAIPTLLPRDISVACVGYEYASSSHPLNVLCADIVLAVQVCLIVIKNLISVFRYFWKNIPM